MTRSRDKILWLDCIGALVAGVLLIAISPLLSAWGSLPVIVLIGIGIGNLVYGSYSLFVTTRNPRPMILVKLLAGANVGWLFVCLVLLVYFWRQISIIGIVHLAGEGLYVAALGCLEWHWRNELGDSRSPDSRLPIGG